MRVAVMRFWTGRHSFRTFIFAKTMDFANALNVCDLCIRLSGSVPRLNSIVVLIDKANELLVS